MYPIQCHAGFSMPLKAGKFEITGFCATVNDPTANSQFAIVDDPTINQSSGFGKLLESIDDQENVLINLKGLASIDTSLSYEFAEPVKTRFGVSIYSSNLKAGSICIYRR
jgi:hypothetical protein